MLTKKNPFKLGDIVTVNDSDCLYEVTASSKDCLNVDINPIAMFTKANTVWHRLHYTNLSKPSVIELCLVRNRLDNLINELVKKNSE